MTKTSKKKKELGWLQKKMLAYCAKRINELSADLQIIHLNQTFKTKELNLYDYEIKRLQKELAIAHYKRMVSLFYVR